MTEHLQCPVCEHQVEYSAGNERSLSRLLSSGVSQVVADQAEYQMRVHLEEHPLEDFVEALVKADAYIALVEDERDEVLLRLVKMEERHIMRPDRPDFPPGPRGEVGLYPGEGQAPRTRQHVDPDKTLIGVIPIDKRADGQVGRRS